MPKKYLRNSTLSKAVQKAVEAAPDLTPDQLSALGVLRTQKSTQTA